MCQIKQNPEILEIESQIYLFFCKTSEFVVNINENS